MFGAFQEVSSAGAYCFTGKTCSMSVSSKIKKLTVSQELLNEIIAVESCSLKKISEETKIPLATLCNIKSGVTRSPRFSTFQKIFRLYCRICC